MRDLPEIVKILTKRRLDLGWSQTRLAEEMHGHQNSIWQWETGKVEPRLGSLITWARTLGYEITVDTSTDRL